MSDNRHQVNLFERFIIRTISGIEALSKISEKHAPQLLLACSSMIPLLSHPVIAKYQQNGIVIESCDDIPNEQLGVIKFPLDLRMSSTKSMASMIHTNDVPNQQLKVVGLNLFQNICASLHVKRV